MNNDSVKTVKLKLKIKNINCGIVEDIIVSTFYPHFDHTPISIVVFFNLFLCLFVQSFLIFTRSSLRLVIEKTAKTFLLYVKSLLVKKCKAGIVHLTCCPSNNNYLQKR